MSQPCWHCLRRANSLAQLKPSTPSRSSPIALPHRTFGTTSTVLARKETVRGKVQSQARKRDKRDKGRPPAQGERREFRKRVVLSNTNALDIPNLPMWHEDNVGDKELLGKVVSLEGPMIDRLRALEGFQPKQAWKFFKRPSCVVRPVTAQLHDALDDAKGTPTQHPKTGRAILTGERGSGKSVALLQAMAMAFMKGYVVIHIPDAQELVLGQTHYAPLDAPTSGNPALPLYVQRDYTAKLLASIAKANNELLSTMQLSLTHTGLPIPLRASLSLARLAELGAADPDIAWPIFSALWRELTSSETIDGQRRAPILLALDGLAHVCRPSQYLAPSMHFIHAHDLALVEHFVRYLSTTDLPNGGLVLAADSASNRPENPSLDLAVRRAREAGTPIISSAPASTAHVHDEQKPWTPIDERSVRALSRAAAITLDGLSREEARALLEYYALSGMWRGAVDERTLGDTWTLAGRGIVGELERVTVRSMRV